MVRSHFVVLSDANTTRIAFTDAIDIKQKELFLIEETIGQQRNVLPGF
jgi:hypothetical protein